jgi:hypothetical protein
MGIALEHQSQTIEMLTKENTVLRNRNSVGEGRITRLEKVVEDQREETIQINARSMKDNIIFQDIPEQLDEHDVKQTLLCFLEKEMQVSQDDLSRIGIRKVYRMGMKGTRPRNIIVNIDDEGKSVIWKHTRNLRGKSYSVFTQLPRELAERKRQLVPRYKAAKTQKQKVKWAAEKLIINDSITEVKRDTLKDINRDTTEEATKMRVKRSPPKTYVGSSFQGARVEVSTPDDVIPALQAIYTDVRSARATHNIYAYRITSGNHTVTEHYEDDGEYGAGHRLLQLLQKQNVSNQLICVSRWYGGKHLGSARFNYVEEAGKDVLATMNL